mgnify:FL=1
MEARTSVLVVVAASGAATRDGLSILVGVGYLLVLLLSALQALLAARGSVALLDLGLALPGAGVRSLILLLVVGVQNESKLLSGRAHAVSTEVAEGGVASDTVANGGVLTADGTEKLAEALLGEIVRGNAGERVDHALAERLVRSGRELLSSLPVLLVGGRALGGGGRRLVGVLLDTLGVSLENLLLEGAEVLHLLSGVAGNLDQTVVVGFLEVHVDDTTAEDIGHLLVVVQSIGLLKNTALSTVGQVAAVLGKEDGHVVVLEELDLVRVTRSLHGVLAAPRVDVVAPEINGILRVTAVEVVGNFLANILVIVGGITNTHPATALALDVLLAVTDGSLDVGGGRGVGGVVANLVTGEETDNVGVLAHLVDDGLVAVEKLSVPLGVVAVDGEHRLAQIGNDVDVVLVEQLHALAVILLRVNGVGSDDVGAELSKKRNITLASLSIGQRVLVLLGGGAGRSGRISASSTNFTLVGDTLHEELSSVGEEELGALDLDGGQLSSSAARQSEEREGESSLHCVCSELVIREIKVVL